MACFTCSRAWCARVLCELGVLTCLACFIKWSASRASKSGVLGVFHKVGRVNLLNCFRGVFDQGALVNCKF